MKNDLCLKNFAATKKCAAAMVTKTLHILRERMREICTMDEYSGCDEYACWMYIVENQNCPVIM